MRYNRKKIIDLILSDRKTNKEISKKTGISDNMIGKISRGESIPSLNTLPLLAELYGKDINYFFDLESKEQIKQEEISGVRITDANNYMVDRFENVVRENMELKQKLKAYEDISRGEYTMQNVPTLSAAEPTPELKKNRH